MLSYGQTLRKLIRPDRFPALHAVVEAGVFDVADDPDADFMFALHRVLDGIAALNSSRS